MLEEVVEQLSGTLTGSALLDEADTRLGHDVSANALMWFVLDRRRGDFDLARALVRARYLQPDRATVDHVMKQVAGLRPNTSYDESPATQPNE